MSRITWDEYYVQIVKNIAKRATCDRKQVGAIIVNNRNRIVGTGYNGSPRGMEHCDEVGHLMVDGHCVRTIHAEQNALLQTGREAEGGTLYCTTLPCPICLKLIIQAGVQRVVYLEDYNLNDVAYWINNSNIKVEKYKEVTE